MTQYLDGRPVAAQLQTTLAETIKNRLDQGLRAPGLAVILVGQDPASAIYVANKRKACQAVGIRSLAFDLPQDCPEQELLALIQQLNADETVDGILVQLPLPKAINATAVIEAIHPAKDVDGFHPYNQGRLMQNMPLLRPCTPFGIMQLLNAYAIPITGQETLVIGQSTIVGKPMVLEFLLAKATVTCCHSLTRDLRSHVERADLIVVATGVKDVIAVDWLQKHQVIVDVGMHRLDNGQLRGDVDCEKALGRVAWISPVPGGVGPMTVATLMQNTLTACLSLTS